MWVILYHGRSTRSKWSTFVSLTNAIILATEAHADQVDKSDVPYIFHPLRVMEAARAQGLNEVALQAAVLHDVVEDTDVTIGYIGVFFGEEVQTLVSLLTRLPNMTHREYITRMLHNRTAIRLKICDVLDNMSPERHATWAAVDLLGADGAMRRYGQTLQMLQEALV